MTTHSRPFYVIFLISGLVTTLLALASLLSQGDRTPLGHVVQIAFGLAVVTCGAYGSLHPEKTNNPMAVLFGAGVGLVLTCVLFLFLLHFYGNMGFFATGDSTAGVGAIAFMFTVSVWLLFYSRFLRQKGQH